MKFPHLFSPIEINNAISKNRIVATPTGDFFEDKALGGAGIVIAGHAIVEPGRSSFASPDEPDAFAKYEVEETRRRVLKAQLGGALCSIEIFHGGEYARVKDFARGPMDKVREDGTIVKAMTEADMDEVAALFAKTVCDARDTGFDMAFLHFGHGWLPAQFLSPRNNQRTDHYGGSLENRARFPLQILRTIREAVGPHFPLDMRISATEFMDVSVDFADVLQFIKWAEPYIDAVQISAGVDIGIQGNVHVATTVFEPHMPNAAWATEVKKHVDIKVGVVGAIMNPQEAEDLIASGAVDLVGLGRPLIADPDWPRKAQEGRDDQIVPCIRCLQCYHISTNRRHVGCSVNPRFWNESFIPKTLTPALKSRRILVVGGGPGGIVAALTAAERGHDVTLVEKDQELGGQLRWVAKEFYKEDTEAYLSYLLRQVAVSTVTVKTDTAASPEMVREFKPDALVLAMGATEAIPPIKGIDSSHVMAGSDVLENLESIGKSVAIIGAGQVGIELGLELATIHGRKVTMIEAGSDYAQKGNSLYREGLRQRLVEAESLTYRFESACEEIMENQVVVRDKNTGIAENITVDTVVVAVGMRPRNREAKDFYGITPDTRMIGDCVMPRIIQDAVYEGYAYAMNI